MIFRRTPVSRIILVIFLYFAVCSGEIFELSKDNVETFRKGKLLVVIFVDSPSCTRCRLQFPFFVAASQAFPSDPQIFFARVRDKLLIKEWGITELPALLYYRDGLEEPDFFLVDVTVDDIIDEIARRLHGNFGGQERFYAVDVTEKNFREMVKTPNQDVLLIAYDKTTLEELKVVEDTAKAFRNDDAVLICKLNVDKEKPLRDRVFLSRDVPSVFYFAANDKDIPKRFGGAISVFMQTTFINERTRLNRNPDGTLQPTAGRVEAYDKLIVENGQGVLSGDKEAIDKLVSKLQYEDVQLKPHETPYSDYYMFLLEKIAATGKKADIIDSLEDDIYKKLNEDEDLLPKQEDTLKRKRNILIFFSELSAHHRKWKKEKEEDEKKAADEIKRKETMALYRAQQEEQRRKAAKGQPDQFTAKATVHRRAHEEL